MSDAKGLTDSGNCANSRDDVMSRPGTTRAGLVLSRRPCASLTSADGLRRGMVFV